jgi:hypothetical protein
MKNEKVNTAPTAENENLPAQQTDNAPATTGTEIVPLKGVRFADIAADVDPEELIKGLENGEVGKVNAVRNYIKFNERKGPEKFVFLGFDVVTIPSTYTGEIINLTVAVLMDASGNLYDNGTAKLLGALRSAPVPSGWEITFQGIQSSGKNNLHDLRVLPVKLK